MKNKVMLFEEFVNESINSTIDLIEIVWCKYNPTLHSGEYTELSSNERQMIKDIISLKNKGLDYNEMSNKLNLSIEMLNSVIEIFNNDLIRRSLPQ